MYCHYEECQVVYSFVFEMQPSQFFSLFYTLKQMFRAKPVGNISSKNVELSETYDYILRNAKYPKGHLQLKCKLHT